MRGFVFRVWTSGGGRDNDGGMKAALPDCFFSDSSGKACRSSPVGRGRFCRLAPPGRGRAVHARRPAVFFDRDGVLNRDLGYIWRPSAFHWTPGARQAIRRCNRRGVLAIVVTNQSGIARRYYSRSQAEALHAWMNRRLAGLGARIDAFYYCPYHPTEGEGNYRRASDCRKPAPGMLLRAMREWPIDPARSLVIGDRESDMEAARRAGLRGARFRGGNLMAALRRFGV